MSSVWESIETLAGADVERPNTARMMVGNAGEQIGLSQFALSERVGSPAEHQRALKPRLSW